MNPRKAQSAFAALAQPTRLKAFRKLVAAHPEGLPAGDIAAGCKVPHNTMSTHLAALLRGGLVTVIRQGREMNYRADIESFRALIGFMMRDCCGGRPEICAPVVENFSTACRTPPAARKEGIKYMSGKIYNVLFLCTGNSARSVIAEAILNREGRGRFRAFSAGSQPKSQVNPHTLALLKQMNYDTSGLRSKSWQEFARPGAPVLDFVFTVCDNAAGESCPVWPGRPMTAHWGVPDPAEATGSDAEIALAFREAYRMLSRRIELLLALPIDKIDRLALQSRLKDIGGTEGATAMAIAAS